MGFLGMGEEEGFPTQEDGEIDALGAEEFGEDWNGTEEQIEQIEEEMKEGLKKPEEENEN